MEDNKEEQTKKVGDGNRQSLLDVVIDEYNKESGSRTSRLLLTGEIDGEKLRGDVDEEVSRFHNNFISNYEKVPTVILLLSNPSCIICLLQRLQFE